MQVVQRVASPLHNEQFANVSEQNLQIEPVLYEPVGQAVTHVKLSVFK